MLALWSLSSAAYAEGPSDRAIHDVLYKYHRLQSIERFCAQRKFTSWTPEDESTRVKLSTAIHKANPMGDAEYSQLLDEILNGKEYNLAMSYWQYLEIPHPPLEKGLQGVHFKMTDSEWKADKEAKRAELIEWCASADKKFRKILDDFVTLHLVPAAKP